MKSPYCEANTPKHKTQHLRSREDEGEEGSVSDFTPSVMEGSF
jgi:hypothetical protein